MPTPIAGDQLAAADVLLYRGTGVISRLIRLFDRAEVSHAGLHLRGAVAEAIAQGVVEQPLSVSVAEAERVVVRRLAPPRDPAPVAQVAERIVADGPRYGYEQILLLAVLSLTRALPAAPVLARLVRRILDEAAARLADLGEAGVRREPMICSEFVFRCHSEAGAGYALEIDLASPRAARAGALRGVEPGSILASVPELRRSRRAPAGLAAPVTESLEELADRYDEERARAVRGSAVDFSEVLPSAETFANRWLAARNVRAARGADVLAALSGTVADFVTPGDLAMSKSLADVGDLDLARERPRRMAMPKSFAAPPPPAAAPSPATPRVSPSRGATRSVRANGSATPGASGAAAPAEPSQVTRFPSIELAGDVRPDADVELQVDLALERDERTDARALALHFPEGWTDVPVQVRVIAPLLELEAEEGEIVVRNGKASFPFITRGRVKADLGDHHVVEVRASFHHGGKFCGSGRRAFPVAGRDARPPEPAPAAPPPSDPGELAMRPAPVPIVHRKPMPTAKTAGPFAADPTAAGPKLTLEMFHVQGMPEGTFLWHMDCAPEVHGECSLPPSLKGVVNLEKAAPQYVADLFATVEKLDAPDHLPFFQGLGDRLFERTPQCFRDVYSEMVKRYDFGFPIQIVSDDPYVPWELMRPKVEGKPRDFLGVKHPIGRWFSDHEGSMQASLRAGAVATIAPDYAGRPELRPLPAALEEARDIVDRLGGGARKIPAKKAEVLKLLEDQAGADVALLHYAGHGSCETASPDFACLYLEDGDLRVYDVRREENQLGEHRSPLVFLNACQVARTGLALGVIGGFAEALMDRRFGGVIAPLWAVFDEDAHTASVEFVQEAVTKRREFATVLRELRERLAATSPTFLSYLFYGNVMSRFE